MRERLAAEGGMQLLERFDSFAQHRNQLRSMAERVGEYAGLPCAIEDEELIIEPSYPFAKVFNKKDAPLEPGITIHNHFYSDSKRCMVFIYEENGKIGYALEPAYHHIAYDLRTMGCSVAWGIEQESKALQLLGTLLKHHMFKSYLLTGMFIETSKRSGLKYIFRRLKPTVVLKNDNGEMKILCCLCQHPIGYYKGSWAGAMCPTDDVISHLMMMRADEHMFWKRSAQHSAYRPEAGL